MLNSRSLPPLPPAVSISQCFPPLPAGPEAHVEVRQIHVIVHVGFFEKRVDMTLGDKPAQRRYNAQENSIMLFTVNQAKQPLKLLGVPASRENLRKCVRAKYLYEADSYKLKYLQRMYRSVHRLPPYIAIFCRISCDQQFPLHALPTTVDDAQNSRDSNVK